MQREVLSCCLPPSDCNATLKRHAPLLEANSALLECAGLSCTQQVFVLSVYFLVFGVLVVFAVFLVAH